MQNRNKHQALIEKINEFGKHGIPFFLIVDFSMQHPRLFNLDELINNKIQIDFPTYKTPHLILIFVIICQFIKQNAQGAAIFASLNYLN